MDEREELERLLAIFFASNRQPHMSGDPRNRLSPLQRRDLEDAVHEVLAAGWRKFPAPGSAEWAAMVERAFGYFYYGSRAYDPVTPEAIDAALRAALGIRR